MINAIRFIRDLRDSGFPDQQAETIVDVINKSLQYNFATREDVVTLNGKVDLAVKELDTKIDKVYHELDSKIDRVHHELNTKIDKLEHVLTVKMGAMFVLNLTLTVSIMSFILKH